jgi:putative membrane protein
MQQGRTLVLSVDRDDDIGFKAKIVSPAIGRAACLNAANALGLADPEDSDVNAIFQTVKIYDELLARGEDVEIAVIAGDHMHMLEGDRKIGASLEQVIQKTGSTNCIVVTDGAEDEFVVPIIQSKLPVTSIRRVVVKQIPNLEGTYYIIKKFLNDPKVARLVLIPVGLAMLLYAATYLLGYPQVAIILVVGAIGLYFLYRGIGLDDSLRGFINALQTSLTRGRISFVTYIAGILLVIVGIVMGLTSVLTHYSSDGTFGILLYLLTFIYGAVLWMTLAGIVSSIGIIIDHFFYDREELAKVIVFPFFISAVGLILYGVSVYVIAVSNVPDFPFTVDSALQFFVYVTIGGLICAFAGMGVQHLMDKWLVEHGPPQIIEVM